MPNIGLAKLANHPKMINVVLKSVGHNLLAVYAMIFFETLKRI